ncbi:MAG: phage integrase family protein, partial [Devosia sp.]|uniref:site-specific integrase n=1 Tax=Devosia sp. TaxID=1871048 RepID=UPI0026140A92
KGKLKVGVDIPTPVEIAGIVRGLEGRWRPLLMTAIFTGLRASELRGLTWAAVDLKAGRIRVFQRADRFKAIGKPKSLAGERDVPLPPIVANTLREWKLVATKSEAGLVFPNLKGQVQAHRHLIDEGFLPAQLRGDVVVVSTDEDGKEVRAAKYTGLHCLRHFYASWCINRKADGGLELPAKIVQQRLGHASINLTMDTYGHLFPSTDDGTEMAAAEAMLLSTPVQSAT